MKIKYKGLMALALVVFEASLAPIAFQIGGSSIGAMPFLLYSLLATAAVMAIVSYLQDRGRGFLALFRNRNLLLMLCMLGIFSYGISRWALTVGTVGTTPSISGILYRTYPLMVIAMTPLLLGQKVSGRQLVALVLGFASVGIVLSEGSITSINFHELPYVALILVSASGVALSAVLVNKYNLGSSGFILFASLVSVLFISPIMLLMHISLPTNLTPATLASIVLIGAIFGGIGSTLFYYSYKIFNTSFTGFIMLTVPFFTVVLSFLLLGTPMESYYFVAAGFLVAGMLIHGGNQISAPVHVKKRSTLMNLQIFDVTGAFANNSSEGIGSRIAGGSRAFAIRLGGTTFDEEYHNAIFSRHKCVAFVTTRPHTGAREEEIEFVNDILGLRGEDAALIGIGKPEDLEDSFDEFLSTNIIDKTESGGRRFL